MIDRMKFPIKAVERHDGWALVDDTGATICSNMNRGRDMGATDARWMQEVLTLFDGLTGKPASYLKPKREDEYVWVVAENCTGRKVPFATKNPGERACFLSFEACMKQCDALNMAKSHEKTALEVTDKLKHREEK